MGLNLVRGKLKLQKDVFTFYTDVYTAPGTVNQPTLPGSNLATTSKLQMNLAFEAVIPLFYETAHTCTLCAILKD